MPAHGGLQRKARGRDSGPQKPANGTKVKPVKHDSAAFAAQREGLKHRQEHCSISRIKGLVHRSNQPVRLFLYASVTASFRAEQVSF